MLAAGFQSAAGRHASSENGHFDNICAHPSGNLNSLSPRAIRGLGGRRGKQARLDGDLVGCSREGKALATQGLAQVDKAFVAQA